MVKQYSALIATIASFATVLIVIWIAHAVIPVPDDFEFDPVKTCKHPPLECWDGLSKPLMKCSNIVVRDTVLRSGSVLPAGESTCYKSIYFNLDATTFYVVVVMTTWMFVVSRIVERLVIAFLDGSLRFFVAIPLLLAMPSLWYSYSVVSHYLNDRFFYFFASQVFFGVTETLICLFLLFHVRKDDIIRPRLLCITAAIALFHLVELILDEKFSVFYRARNIMLASIDAGSLFSSLSLLRVPQPSSAPLPRYLVVSGKRFVQLQHVQSILIYWVSLWVIFQIFFADGASFNLFPSNAQ